jgi:hypothetical protein
VARNEHRRKRSSIEVRALPSSERHKPLSTTDSRSTDSRRTF